MRENKFPKNLKKMQQWKEMSLYEWFMYKTIFLERYTFTKNDIVIEHYFEGTNEELREELKMNRTTFFGALKMLKCKGLVQDEVLKKDVKTKVEKKRFIPVKFWKEEDGKIVEVFLNRGDNK